MNLSDTSIDSSDHSGILDNGESDIAANLQVNLSVTSSIQSDRIQDAKSVQDLVAENNRLVQENDALKQRVAELEAAEAVGAGGGAGGGEAGRAAGGGADGGGADEGPAAAAAHSKPWSQCTWQWKRRRTKGIASEIDRVAESHQTTAITVAAHMLRRKARVAAETDIWIIAQKIEKGLSIDTQTMSLLVASWLSVRSNRTGLGQRVYTKIKTVFERMNLCRLPSHKTLFGFWKNTIITPIEASREGTSEVMSCDDKP